MKNIINKILIWLAATGIVFGAGTTVPMIDVELEWVISQERLKFDTASGWIEPGQYALTPDEERYFICRDGENCYVKLKQTLIKDADITGLEQVNVIGKQYINLFKDLEDKLVEQESTKTDYEYLGKTSGAKPVMTEKVSLLQAVKTSAAIAFDSSESTAYSASVTSITFAHTVTGSNTLLVVNGGIWTDAGRTITGIAYNADAMTQVDNAAADANNSVYHFFLVNPDTGTNNVVISCNVNCDLWGGSASYTGVAQTGQPDANNKANGTGDPVSVTVTTIANNSWHVMTNYANSGADGQIAGAGTTLRENVGATGMVIADSNGPVTPAGDSTLSTTDLAVNGKWAAVDASYAPAAASDSCTPPTSGDWYIKAKDNCYVKTNTYVAGKCILLNTEGPGALYIIDGARLSCHGLVSTSTPIKAEGGTFIDLDTD